jgi:hypothetical protein
MERDVILTALACPPEVSCNERASLFKEEPLILHVKESGYDFQRKAVKWLQTGDLFRAAIDELSPGNKGIEIRRRGLVSFSAGWYFGNGLLSSSLERDRLNAYIALDGIHTSVLNDWVLYAQKAINCECLFAMAHSQIVPPFVSASTTNNKIFNDATKGILVSHEEEIPNYIRNLELPPEGVEIARKKWLKDPYKSGISSGLLYKVDYNGGDGPTHTYIQRYASMGYWQLLAETWNVLDLN